MRYIDRLAAVNQAAADQMQAYIQRNGFGNTEQIISLAAALADKYGEAAAAATCDMYDAVAAAQGVSVPPAEPARTPSLQEVKDVIEYALDQAPTTVPAKTGALVKKTSTRTMRKNAARDGAKMALVPSGDGCAFCKMLGSRGWEDARSSKSFEAHLHAHCRCEYVVRFSDNLEVEGYDPDALYEEYLAGGDSSQERMNAMRRTYRADHKDEINAQKRAAYAAQKEQKNRTEYRSGGRIINPDGDYERVWAKEYYEEIRHKSTDCKKIAERLSIDEETIKSIKNYLFFEGEWYNPVTGRNEKFIPDATIAQSWQRLAEGKEVKPHDITLIKHEEFEMRIKRENPGISHDDAHIMASKKNNYQKEAEEYYAEIRKRSKNE